VLGSALLLTLVNVVNNAAVLGFGLYIARRLDTGQYGQYAYLANVFLLLCLFLGFGLTSQVAKDVAERARHKTGETALLPKISGLLALRLLTCLLAGLTGGLLALAQANPLYFYAGSSAALFMYSDFIIGTLNGLQRLKSVAILLALQPLSFLGLSLLVPLSQIGTIYNLFLASHLLAATTASLFFLTRPGLRVLPRFSAMRRLEWRRMVAGQAYLIVLLQMAYGAYGVTVLGILGQYSGAGEFSIALTVVRLLPIFTTTLINSLFYPRLCAMYKQGEQARLREMVGMVYRLGIIVAVGSAALLLVYGDGVITLVYTARHAAAIPILQLLAALSFFGVADLIITWTLLAISRPWQVLQPLLVRTLVLLATLPLALLLHSDGPDLTLLLGLGYLGSSLAGWILQLALFRRAGYSGETGFIGLILGLAMGLGLFVRYIIPWPFVAGLERTLSSLLLAGLLYAFAAALIFWQQARKHFARI